MQAKYLRDQIELSISGADGLANNIPQASVKAYHLVLPVLAEQKTIVDSLHREIRFIHAQEVKVSEVAERLREYRSALITNAVTGKIDVQSVSIPSSANIAVTTAEE
jgi:type I restriction enzyme S subunit